MKSGDKVLVISNEKEPILIGTFVEYRKIAKHHSFEFPIVLVDDKELICMGAILKYNIHRYLLLDKTEAGKERYQKALQIKHMFGE